MRPSLKPLTLALVLGALIAVPAIAQQSPGAYPPACEAAKVSKADVERAHTVFLSGKQYLEESNYEKAISYFKDAYSIDCSIHAILPIIATAYERKGDRAEAVRALDEYQKRAPTAPDHEVIERRIRNLKDQVAREQAAAAAAAAAAASAIAPPPTATAAPSASTAPGPVPAASTASSAPPVPAAAAPAPATEGGHSIAPWIAVGAGGAAVVAGAILYVIGSGEVSTAESHCPPPSHKCVNGDVSNVSLGNDGRTLEIAGVVVGGVGLAAAATGVIWHFLESPSVLASTGSAHIVPVVVEAPGGGRFTGLSLSGSF